MFLTHRKLHMAVAAGLAVTAAYTVTAVAQEATASGEVRRVDAVKGEVTIKHGAISDLGLPAMVLVYQANPDVLKDIKPGDKITFTAKREGGANGKYVVTQIKK